MSTNEFYIFKSARLGFRNWLEADVDKLTDINQDPQVMEFFPGLQSQERTRQFVKRMKSQFQEKGFCYFAVEELSTNEFIGFIGLSVQNFESDFTPCIDIGWRLHTEKWNQGFATEGALRCIDYGFNDLKLKVIHAIAPKANASSVRVMQKIGMKELKRFHHPLLASNEKLQECVLYEIVNNLRA
ncbi:GNAT family N-acetyltransferase [Pedobacter foliorum]|uniref:GNAT family N-acetyltransferase n=1 Tax=Pedobacter foliorum TaxID=2739058 RepID=UPI0015634CB9|nr:GNAT family N-acetyltransferase [Pedobacter foliorum]NRF42029.1 GNAT family N-acetyltransferase [Pedobacter foliorum]